MGLYEKIVSGDEKIALTGLGYVGMPIAVAFAKKVKVIGFDNNIYSSLSIPSITTFDRNVDMIASTACTKLMERIESDHKFIDEEIIINGSLIERQSC